MRPLGPAPKASRSAPKIYVPPPVMHVAARAPRAAPVHVAPTNLRTAANPRGVAVVQRHTRPTVNDRAARTLGTGANPRGVAIAGPKPKGRDVKAAIRDVFNHQNPKGQAAIIRGVLAGRADPATARAVRDAWHALPIDQAIPLASYLPHPGGINLGKIATETYGLLSKGSTPSIRSEATGNFPQPGAKALAAGAQAAGSLIQKIPTGAGLPTEQKRIISQSGLGSGQLAKNLGKDVLDYTAEMAPSTALTAQKALSGDWQGALDAFTQPFANTFGHGYKHFLKATAAHPLGTGLLAQSVLDPAAAVGEFGIRAALRKGPLDLQRPSVHLTAGLTRERPDYSRFPIARSMQKLADIKAYERDPASGLLMPRSEMVRRRLAKIETSRLVGIGERIRRGYHENQMLAHGKSVRLPLGGRVAHAARTTLTKDPGLPLHVGAEVLRLIEDGTFRRPETAVADAAKYERRVRGNLPNLKGRPKDLAQAKRTIKVLEDFQKNPPSPRELAPIFKASDTFGHDQRALEGQAQPLGQFNDMTQEALDRRALQHVVEQHMPGARLDPEHGMVQDVTSRKSGTVSSRKLSTAEMKAFALKETGGRMPAYVPDRPLLGDRAHYVRQELRPMPARMGNTLFNHHHGLIEPSHEALLEQRVHLQGIINAHHTTNRLDENLVLVPGQHEGDPLRPVAANRKGWDTWHAAAQDAPHGYVPIRLARPFHPAKSLTKSLESDNVNMTPLQEEAAMRNLDINERLSASDEQGHYGLIDETVANHLRSHENLISPGAFLRSFRSLTGQFRKVALGTSFRHLPGVAQEVLIRAAMSGLGPISYLAGRASLHRGIELDPRLGYERKIELTGGQAVGQALSLQTRQVSRHFEGTLLEAPLRAWEHAVRYPGLRQMSTLWRTWLRFTLNGTKRMLEDTAHTTAIGKQVINDFGGRHGLLAAVMGDWGKMIDQAGKGILDERYARRLGAGIRRIYGRWTDLTPGEQQALMFSPFGMWWTNSVAWLVRLPIDHPIGAGLQAAMHQSTQRERVKLGLDMFSPNHLPLYEQGGIPLAGKLWGASYYSPMGVASDPREAATSLILPWVENSMAALGGKDWLGRDATTPGGVIGPAQIAELFANSVVQNFIPLVTKAQVLVEGGGKAYTTSNLLSPQTYGKNPGLLKGLEKGVMPLRIQDPGVRYAPTPTPSGPGNQLLGGGGNKLIGGGGNKLIGSGGGGNKLLP